MYFLLNASLIFNFRYFLGNLILGQTLHPVHTQARLESGFVRRSLPKAEKSGTWNQSAAHRLINEEAVRK